MYLRNYLLLSFSFNRQAFENIYRMLRPGGTMLTLFVASHDTFTVFELMAQDIHFAPYMEVNIIIYFIYAFIYNYSATIY